MYVALFSMRLEGAVSLKNVKILVLLCFLLIMLLEFSVTNFRSIKEKQTLKQKRLNVFNALAYLIAKRVVNNS
jgi:hypothetical protein